ncbi:MAG: hypothetical protein BMS9Abin04_052 [Planctomycetia bacterium]|nr:MAG: hypothetical protein BMS9Abin04_052 [Planctomycetia bacterium]
MIRLRGPWQCAPVPPAAAGIAPATGQPTGDRPASRAVLWPVAGAVLAAAEWHDQVCFRRRFTRPTGLGPRSTVELVVEGPRHRGQVWLNGTRLGDLPPPGAARRFDITRHLGDRNEVALRLDLSASNRAELCARPTLADVTLEITEG